MSETQLTAIVAENKQEACLSFFRGMPEAERRSLAPICLKLLKRVKKDGQEVITAEAAVLATGTFSELRAVSWRVAREQELAYAVLVDRRPEWIAQYVDKLLDETYYWFHWPLVRRLVRERLISPPQSPNYVLAIISGLVGGPYVQGESIEEHLLADPELLADEVWKLFEYEGGGENSLANWDRFGRSQKWHDALLNLAAAGHLPRERLLRATLEALERDFNHYRARWFATFHDGLAPTPAELRAHAATYLRLVGASAGNIATWALATVERLAKENVFDAQTLADGLLPAWTARQKGMAKQALALMDCAAQTSLADAREAVRAAATALGHEAADVQRAAIDLIERHPAAVDADLAATIASQAPSVAATLRDRLSRWMPDSPPQSDKERGAPPAAKRSAAKQQAPTASAMPAMAHLSAEQRQWLSIDALLANIEAQRADIPAVTFDGTEIPRLPRLEPMSPIHDLDELIDVCAAAIEDGDRVDEIERALDGLCRLCGHKPDDFDQRVAPLAKRVSDQLKKKLAAPFLGNGPRDDLCGVIYAWTKGNVIEWKKGAERRGIVVATVEGETISWYTENLRKGLGLLSRRAQAIARQVAAGQPQNLLSAPTHAGGWIAPTALVERVNARSGDDPEVGDVCLAMLRLAPDERAEALGKLKDHRGEWRRAIRYALGAPRVALGETAALWIAAARARSPWQDDERVEAAFPDHGPDAGRAATYIVQFKTDRKFTNIRIKTEPPLPKSIDADCATVVLHVARGVGHDLQWELGGPAGRTTGAVRWTATLWPQARESFCAAALETIADNLDWWEAAWQNKTLLEPLLDGGTPLRSMGLMLLITALAAKEPGEYGLATDIAIRAIDDGRLGSDNLGEMLKRLLPTNLIKPGRWQKTLADVARVSPLHGLVVQRGLQHALTGQPEKLPRDYAKLLELLHELSAELQQPIDEPACREFLARLKTGKGGKIAKDLLALAGSDFTATVRPLLQQAIERRLEAHHLHR